MTEPVPQMLLPGTPPYTYLWTPGNQTTQTISGLCAGTYSCVVTDATSLTTSGSYTVTSPSALATTISSTAILCNGGNASAAATLQAEATDLIFTRGIIRKRMQMQPDLPTELIPVTSRMRTDVQPHKQFQLLILLL